MFTGIIQEIGRVQALKATSTGKKLEILCPKIAKDLELGDSVAIDGACLTVEKKLKNGFECTAIPETITKTKFKNLEKGTMVNLETSLRYGGKVSGHLVTGHVDTTAKITNILKKNNKYEIEIEAPSTIKKYIATKGCVTINGISLTVKEKKEKKFSIALIPFTLQETNLGTAKKGDLVNLEIDLIARYLFENK
ncbi:MAG: riboflavin synthase [Patescibacteria group bacterium]